MNKANELGNEMIELYAGYLTVYDELSGVGVQLHNAGDWLSRDEVRSLRDWLGEWLKKQEENT